MKLLKIDKNRFEYCVPVMKNAENNIWESVQSALDASEADIIELIGHDTLAELAAGELNRNREEAEHLVCLSAARRVLAQLDVVLTDVGFGVVNNQNLAPASRERVAAVAETLRQEESTARDRLIAGLIMDTLWGLSPEAARKCDTLFYSSVFCRRYGIKIDGKRVYEEEWQALHPQIVAAQRKAERIISPELMAYLIIFQRVCFTQERDDLYIAYFEVLEETRKFIAACLMNDPYKLKVAVYHLRNTMRRNADKFPQYSESATAKALDLQDYENKQGDASFFF